MPEDLLAGIVKEGQLDDVEEKETPEGSQPENKPKEEEPSHQGDDDEPDKSDDKEGDEPDKPDDKLDEPNTDDEDDKKSNIPFHKHPRFKQIIDDNKSLKKTIEDLTSKQNETNEKLSNIDNKETIPKWFSELYGDNQSAWEMYNERTQTERKQMKQEILSEIKEEQSKATKETDKWNDWVSDEVQSLKDEGLKFNENKLMKVVADYRPTDDKGNLDFKKAYDIMQMLGTKKPNTDRKKVADGTTKQTKSESKSEEFQTSHSLKNEGWH